MVGSHCASGCSSGRPARTAVASGELAFRMGLLHFGGPAAVLLMSAGLFGVDPTRLELVTSAMRGRRDEFASVRQCSKDGLLERNSLSPPFSPFASVRPGNC